MIGFTDIKDENTIIERLEELKNREKETKPRYGTVSFERGEYP